jgi:hypothetical protein
MKRLLHAAIAALKPSILAERGELTDAGAAAAAGRPA